MLTQRIITHRTDGIVSLAPSEAGIAIRDKNGRLILVGTREVHLTPREYAVFEYLFEKAGEVCTKAELVNRVDDKGLYPENYAHTLVKVIRAKIEDDPERPRYLVNVSSAGYRLVTNPK
jgi:two-component system KDP operon response regulator KdpE